MQGSAVAWPPWRDGAAAQAVAAMSANENGGEPSPVDQTFEMDLSLQIGKYDIRRQLGKGATGTVYLAVDTFSGNEVALKTIEPEVFRDPEFGAVYRPQFLNEASLAGKLKHPHIVGILDAVVQEDSGHIAMEVVPGGDLSQHVSADTLLPVEDVLQIGFKCCGALDYAFNEGIVHRDIKPANIMIAQRHRREDRRLRRRLLRKAPGRCRRRSIGSPYYMSPEQIEEAPLTFHSDMYSLGVVLYELLTGQRPFTADNMETLMQKILHRARPRRRPACAPTLPKEIDASCCARWPRSRQSATRPGPISRSNCRTWASWCCRPTRFMDSEKYVGAQERGDAVGPVRRGAVGTDGGGALDARRRRRRRIVRENEPGQSFFFLAQGQVKVTRKGGCSTRINDRECFGEMAYIRGGEMPRHATVESMTELLLAEFDPETLARMSLGAQLHLTRALVRNLVDRLRTGQRAGWPK